MTIQLHPIDDGAFTAEINGKVAEAGEGPAEIYYGMCEIHGRVPKLLGRNQGGYDKVSVCLLCCSTIYNKLAIDKILDKWTKESQ